MSIHITNKLYGYIRRMEIFGYVKKGQAAFTLTILTDSTISQNIWLKKFGVFSLFS
jgi:hypothetical protein